MSEMTPEQLAAIKTRADAATKGPWYAVYEDDGDIVIEDTQHNTLTPTAEDFAFMRHAREDIPALHAEVERLGRENEKTREAMNEWAESDARARAEVERLKKRESALEEHCAALERMLGGYVDRHGIL
jgi:chromosome segregation ATPase